MAEENSKRFPLLSNLCIGSGNSHPVPIPEIIFDVDRWFAGRSSGAAIIGAVRMSAFARIADPRRKCAEVRYAPNADLRYPIEVRRGILRALCWSLEPDELRGAPYHFE